jgi:hypothetical protein
MAKSQKTNRDHAKKTTRPMVEDEAIASQLSALLTPAITHKKITTVNWVYEGEFSTYR